MIRNLRSRALAVLLLLVLCLGLLPATALAAVTNTVYVGGVALTGSSENIVYATTNGAGEVITNDATAGNYNIMWDGSTLTLRNATIQKELYDSNLFISGAAIGVINQNGNAELTIQLEGSNTIEKTNQGLSMGIFVYSSGGGAALNIKGNGTLVLNSNYQTIQVISSNGNAALGIKNAKVTAKSSYSNGVTVQSGNSETSSASLTVDGGSLTATTDSDNASGIRFRFSTSGTGNGTPTVTVSNNAIVRANGSVGGITSEFSTGVQYGTGGEETGGIIWNGTEGTVYGKVELQEDLEIGKGETLTIPEGSSLTVPDGKTLTNNGTVTTTGSGSLTNSGTINNSGTLPETIKGNQPPKITTESLNDGTVDTEYNQTLVASGNATITWSLASGTLPTGLQLSDDGKITGTPTTEGTSTFTVTATNNIGSDSREFTLKIEKPAFIPVTDLELNKDSLTLQENSSDTLIATVKPDDATNRGVTWESSDTSIATVSEDGTVTAISAGNATITATAADGSGISASCTLTVTHGNMVQTPKKDATCTVDGTEEYWTCEICGKHFEDESGTIPTTPEENKIQATGHSYGEPVWNWSEDGKTCTVTFTCEKDETHKETQEVKVTLVGQTPATCTEAGVTTYTATVEFNGQTYMDTKDVADIPVTDHSYENGKCTVCGAIDPNFTPEIIAGANGTWQKGTQDGLSFTSNAAFDDFIKVQVDGKDLDASNYTTKEGSTIVTLKASYLETLSVGKHSLVIVSDTGIAETEFTILAASNSDESLVQTGDNNMSLIALLSIIGAMSAVIGVVALRKSRL